MGLVRQRFNQHLATAGMLSAIAAWPAAMHAQQWELVNPPASRGTAGQFATVEQPRQPSGSLQWSRVPSQTPTTTEPAPRFEPATAETTAGISEPELNWQPLTAAEIQQQQQEIQDEIREAQELIANPTIVLPPSGPTYANDRALWRDDVWHPQISSLVPIGFGPKGVMASIGLYGWDCTTSGVCTLPLSWADYQDQIERFGELHYEASLGLGDAEKLLGVTFTGRFEETRFGLGDRNTAETKNIFSNYYVGVHLSRNLSPDTAVRVGIDNWIDVKTCGPYCGYPKSAYGVISQRIRLKDNQEGWFPNAYITVGAGNGQFRSVTEKFQASVAAQRAAGCWTYGYTKGNNCSAETRAKANNRSVSYGQVVPIGSAALEVYPGLNVIGEWSEGNLNAGFSVRPFKQIGLVFTSMWGALLRNCDWGCKVSIPDVPGGVDLEPNLITERVKWSFSLSLNVKF